MDVEKAHGLVKVLSESCDFEEKKAGAKNGLANRVAVDMEILKELRLYIQKFPSSVEVFSRQGIIGILVRKLRNAPDTNQVYILQILAALGFIIQKNEERVQMATECGIFEVIVSKMESETTSDGVLLLIVQLITFLVEDSDSNLRNFAKTGGMGGCIRVLSRGCIRSSMLNAKVATLLGSICDLFPEKAVDVCKQLLEKIHAYGKRIETLAPTKSAKTPTQSVRLLESSCITLAQALGLLLDSKPKRSKEFFSVAAAQTLLGMFRFRSVLSLHLFETLCYTLTYGVAGDCERAKIMCYLNAGEVISRTLYSRDRVSENFVQAVATLLSHLVDARLAGNDSQAKEQADALFEPLLSSLRTAYCPLPRTESSDAMVLPSPSTTSAENPTLSLAPYVQSHSVGGGASICSVVQPQELAESSRELAAFHTTSNGLRVIRKIARIGGQPLDHFISSNAVKVYVDMLKDCDKLKEATKAEILQEVGLLVEHAPQIGLCLAEQGACAELKRIISTCTRHTELCNATRAMACFVEHSSPIGFKITDIALRDRCDDSLIQVLNKAESEGDLPHEVLLNTVGALGYMVKRQTVQARSPSTQSTEKESNIQELHTKYQKASISLCHLLKSPGIGESLTWNSLWALIYLMNGLCSDVCTRAVEGSGGLEIFSKIVASNPQNQPLVCSASKALWHLIFSTDVEVLKSVPLNVRLKVLACATRSQPNASQESQEPAPSFGTLEVIIDPSKIMDTSLCVLEKYNGEQLRNNALKIQYVSGDVEQIGVDAGGVRRDWLSRLSEELFDPKYNLVISGFNPNDSVQISPSPSFGGLTDEEQRAWYKLMGRILALSILYEDPLGVALVPSLSKLILEDQPVFEDIKHVSKEYYRTFSLLKQLRESDPVAFENALRDLTFTVNSRECIMAEAFERDGRTLLATSGNAHKYNNTLQNISSAISHINVVDNVQGWSLAEDEQEDGMEVESVSKSVESEPANLSRFRSIDTNSVWEWDSGDDGGLSPLPPRPAAVPTVCTLAESSTPSVACSSPSSPTLSKEQEQVIKETLDACKTIKDCAKQLNIARARGDRTLIRKLLTLQNELLTQRRSTTDEQEFTLENRDRDGVSHSVSSTSIPTALSGRKRRLSTASSASEREISAKRTQTSAAKMKRMMSDLMDGGQLERIHPGNFDQYLEMLTFKLLVENVAAQVATLKQGFHEVLPREVVLRLLTADEFGKLIEGDRSINIEKWKENTVTKGGTEADTPQLRWFWEYAASLSTNDRRKLLMWATGWRSIGNGGFANRSFTIELTNVTDPAEDERLPSVATCGFHMWLPKYSSRERLEKKFQMAMSETSFGIC